MLTYFYKKPEVVETITMILNFLIRVLLKNHISHSYVFVSSSEEEGDGQCGDLR